MHICNPQQVVQGAIRRYHAGLYDQNALVYLLKARPAHQEVVFFEPVGGYGLHSHFVANLPLPMIGRCFLLFFAVGMRGQVCKWERYGVVLLQDVVCTCYPPPTCTHILLAPFLLHIQLFQPWCVSHDTEVWGLPLVVHYAGCAFCPEAQRVAIYGLHYCVKHFASIYNAAVNMTNAAGLTKQSPMPVKVCAVHGAARGECAHGGCCCTCRAMHVVDVHSGHAHGGCAQWACTGSVAHCLQATTPPKTTTAETNMHTGAHLAPGRR